MRMLGQWEWGTVDPGMWESASWSPDWSSIYDFSSVDINDLGSGADLTDFTSIGVSVPVSTGGGFDILGVLKSILSIATPLVTPIVSTILTSEQKQAQAQAQAQQAAIAQAQAQQAASATQATTESSILAGLGSNLPILAIIAAGIFLVSRKGSSIKRSRRKR
jgi:hypothetical protein